MLTAKTVILAAGDFPSHHVPLQLLNTAAHVVCCDGAIRGLLKYGITPEAIIGDLDSVPHDLPERLKRLRLHDPDQNTNDLTKAFKYCIKQKFNDIVILGATGKREDHTIGNVALLAHFVRSAVNIRMVTDHGIFYPALPPELTLPTTIGAQISLFTMTPDDPVTATGLRYKVENLLLSDWSVATLNEATETTVRIVFARGPIVAYISHLN